MTSSNVDPGIPPHLVKKKSRKLVLCLDGTGEYRLMHNTNVVKLYSILKKDTEEQLCHCVPALGTYFSPDIIQLPFKRTLDKFFALYLPVHVMDAYTFLVENYHVGDKIVIFGFARGAFTARALVGMLGKVGLLRRDEISQAQRAFDLYKSTGSRNRALAEVFKEAYSCDVTIDFVGLWDTVSSAGILRAPTLPFVEVNTMTRVFRQALSLDEHRAKFRPILCTPPNQLSNTYSKAIQLGTDAPSEPLAQIEEVWFPGYHHDVGGGGELDMENQALPNISLAWMIQQILRAECGILFDFDAFDFWHIPREIGQRRDLPPRDGEVSTSDDAPRPLFDLPKASAAANRMTDKLNVKTPWWWILEIFPVSYSYWNAKGKRVTSWWPHFGRARSVPPGSLIHSSVKTLVDDPRVKYKPRASYKDDMVRYVS